MRAFALASSKSSFNRLEQSALRVEFLALPPPSPKKNPNPPVRVFLTGLRELLSSPLETFFYSPLLPSPFAPDC